MTAQLADTDLLEIEELAERDAGEPFRGPLLALGEAIQGLRGRLPSAGISWTF